MATTAQQLMTPDEMKERITPEILETSARQFQRQLITMPVETLKEETLKYITLVPGVRNSVTFGQLSGNAQLAPWSRERNEDADYKIEGRTLQVYPGNCTYDFDPMEVFNSIYGHHIINGDTPDAMQLAREILSLFAASIGKHLNDHVFDAVRNVNGDKTEDLFDGINTILMAEITNEKIKTSKGNMYEFGEVLDKTNTVEGLKDFYAHIDPELKKIPTFMYMDPVIYANYLEDYQATHGALPYNTDYKKLTLENSLGKCTFAPLNNLAGSGIISISTKQNFMLGTDINAQENMARVKEYKPWVFTFLYAGVYGAQVRTLSKELLCVGVLKTDEEGGCGSGQGGETGNPEGGGSGQGGETGNPEGGGTGQGGETGNP